MSAKASRLRLEEELRKTIEIERRLDAEINQLLEVKKTVAFALFVLVLLVVRHIMRRVSAPMHSARLPCKARSGINRTYQFSHNVETHELLRRKAIALVVESLRGHHHFSGLTLLRVDS